MGDEDTEIVMQLGRCVTPVWRLSGRVNVLHVMSTWGIFFLNVKRKDKP
jgi:hypothetical protein